MSEALADPFDPRFARRAPAVLRAFNRAGVLSAADVHVAQRLAALTGEQDPLVALAAALGVRAPRLGHVYVDLATVRATATSELEDAVDLDALDWPPPGPWRAAVARSALTSLGEDAALTDRPLRLAGTRLYLDRYWREEIRVAQDLRSRLSAPAVPIDPGRLDAGVARVFAHAAHGAQARAARAGVTRRLAVVAGGPGTGKTTTVARMLALLHEQAGPPLPLVALAAPTGKAASRLAEAVHDEAARLPVGEETRAALRALDAATLHRLLGRRPDSMSRFRHDRDNRLPHDVVIVDETSMVSLEMMARLLEAVRPDARLVLLGDPGQLTSIEAGAVLGDIAGTATAEGIVVLDRVHRFGGAIADLAVAVRGGDPDAVVEVLRRPHDDLAWVDADPAQDPGLAAVREPATAAGAAVAEAARAGDARGALAALGAFRLLCAHRRGPHGAASWAARVEDWVAGAVGGLGADRGWYAGHPLLVTANDYGLGLFNGDTGVVVAEDDGLRAAFEHRGDIVAYRPDRLAAVDTVYAMTIHKAQGSQFDTAAVLLPPPSSRILTRELLYTAVTRATDRLVLVGAESAVRAAVTRPVLRASGLRERLWGHT